MQHIWQGLLKGGNRYATLQNLAEIQWPTTENNISMAGTCIGRR